ncbi:exodeoxyribonuclease V alpha subunit [Eubacterium uniforme]|uniref:ATP-dependent RecD2 DNA helicase n=1 Tax=Eubacterium uniforme TaxID=39495 RepID=A0A1T4VGE6_9FIRM|nr:ATP-dependent RecD-like DNA helicase [Eubacterium uniforme]SKA63983.1 exodeoxyribonuclease V alpha subunit [Eubacterium uniforme]
MVKLAGYVERILYSSPNSDYKIIVVESEDGSHTCVGNIIINEGEYIVLEGEEIFHDTYGEEIKVSSYEVKISNDELSIRKYLGSGAIKGIGKTMAGRIVDKFGDKTFEIIENEPERLAEVKGISRKGALTIYEQVSNQRSMRDAMIFLQKYGVTTGLAAKIYNLYGNELFNILKTNPYKLADDIEGVGFKIADDIAGKVGIEVDSEYRIKSGITYVLSMAAQNGNTCLDINTLKSKSVEILGVDYDIDKYLKDMLIEQRIKVCNIDGVDFVYDILFYNVEKNIAQNLLKIKDGYEKFSINDDILKRVESGIDLHFNEEQMHAIKEAASEGVMVITGGPGTGKTTIINGIISMCTYLGKSVKLAAPTGKAAKRITESTGYEASTIHRLLEITKGGDASEEYVGRDEFNPIEAEVIIIDEMSMVDIFLMKALLKAIPYGAHLVLVGDKDQLPSVGPGNVLKDIIESGVIKVIELKMIFRQSEHSDIIVNAHMINDGKKVDLTKKSKDFVYVKRDEAYSILGATKTLVMDKLPSYVNSDIGSIQVLTPMKKGVLGVENFNKYLQSCINPKDTGKAEKEYGDKLFREGDKVMQIKNNYDYEWEYENNKGIVIERGTGIFNGDTGIILQISEFANMMRIRFDDGKIVNYKFEDLSDLELAYAITIHKSQGSEYPAVVIPLLTGPMQLMNRNILYTAITRAKQCVCIVGSSEMFSHMIENKSTQIRYSGLKDRLKGRI